MSKHIHIIPVLDIDSTLSRFDEVENLPVFEGSTELELIISNLVIFRKGRNTYIKFIINFGDGSDDLILEKESGFTEFDKELIFYHNYVATEKKLTKNYLTITGIKDDLTVDRYSLNITLRTDHTKDGDKGINLLDSQLHDTTSGDIDNLSLVVEQPDTESVSTVIVPKDKQDPPIVPGKKEIKKFYLPVIDLLDTGINNTYYLERDDIDTLERQVRQDPLMVVANHSKFKWTAKLNEDKHGFGKWIVNNQPFTDKPRTVKVKTRAFIENSKNNQLKGSIKGYVAFAWNVPDGIPAEKSKITNITVNKTDIPLPLLPHDIKATATAETEILNNIENKTPNIEIPADLLKAGWNDVEFTVYVNPLISVPSSNIKPIYQTTSTEDNIGDKDEESPSYAYFGLFVTYYDLEKSIFIEGMSDGINNCKYTTIPDKQYFHNVEVSPPYASLSKFNRGPNLPDLSGVSVLGPAQGIHDVDIYPYDDVTAVIPTTSVSLTAVSGNTGWSFSHWSGEVHDNVHALSANENEWPFNSNRKIIANFNPTLEYYVETPGPGNAMAFVGNVATISGTPSGSVDYGSIITLSATPYITEDPQLAAENECGPSTLFTFKGWRGDVAGAQYDLTSPVNSWTAHMPRTIVAEYHEVPHTIVDFVVDPVPIDVYAYECAPYEFSVRARGVPPITFVWYKADPNVMSWTVIGTGPRYVFDSVDSATDGGYIYMCVATNNVGTVSSEHVTLNVKTQSITGPDEYPPHQTALIGDEITLELDRGNYYPGPVDVRYKWERSSAANPSNPQPGTVTTTFYTLIPRLSFTLTSELTGVWDITVEPTTCLTISPCAQTSNFTLVSARGVATHDSQYYDTCVPLGGAVSGTHFITEDYSCFVTEDNQLILPEHKIGDDVGGGSTFSWWVSGMSTLLQEHNDDKLHLFQQPVYKGIPISQIKSTNIIPASKDPVLRLRQGDSTSEFASTSAHDRIVLEHADYNPLEIDPSDCVELADTLYTAAVSGDTTLYVSTDVFFQLNKWVPGGSNYQWALDRDRREGLSTLPESLLHEDMITHATNRDTNRTCNLGLKYTGKDHNGNNITFDQHILWVLAASNRSYLEQHSQGPLELPTVSDSISSWSQRMQANINSNTSDPDLLRYYTDKQYAIEYVFSIGWEILFDIAKYFSGFDKIESGVVDHTKNQVNDYIWISKIRDINCLSSVSLQLIWHEQYVGELAAFGYDINSHEANYRFILGTNTPTEETVTGTINNTFITLNTHVLNDHDIGESIFLLTCDPEVHPHQVYPTTTTSTSTTTTSTSTTTTSTSTTSTTTSTSTSTTSTSTSTSTSTTASPGPTTTSTSTTSTSTSTTSTSTTSTSTTTTVAPTITTTTTSTSTTSTSTSTTTTSTSTSTTSTSTTSTSTTSTSTTSTSTTTTSTSTTTTSTSTSTTSTSTSTTSTTSTSTTSTSTTTTTTEGPTTTTTSTSTTSTSTSTTSTSTTTTSTSTSTTSTSTSTTTTEPPGLLAGCGCPNFPKVTTECVANAQDPCGCLDFSWDPWCNNCTVFPDYSPSNPTHGSTLCIAYYSGNVYSSSRWPGPYRKGQPKIPILNGGQIVLGWNKKAGHPPSFPTNLWRSTVDIVGARLGQAVIGPVYPHWSVQRFYSENINDDGIKWDYVNGKLRFCPRKHTVYGLNGWGSPDYLRPHIDMIDGLKASIMLYNGRCRAAGSLPASHTYGSPVGPALAPNVVAASPARQYNWIVHDHFTPASYGSANPTCKSNPVYGRCIDCTDANTTCWPLYQQPVINASCTEKKCEGWPSGGPQSVIQKERQTQGYYVHYSRGARVGRWATYSRAGLYPTFCGYLPKFNKVEVQYYGMKQNSCITGDTKITMSDGTYKLAKDILEGDKVKTGNTHIGVVFDIETTNLNGGKLYSINDTDKFITPGHPILTKEGWKSIDPAQTAIEEGEEMSSLVIGPLEVGDFVKGEDNWIEVTSIESQGGYPHNTLLYTFDIDGDNRDYFFANGILIHNQWIPPYYKVARGGSPITQYCKVRFIVEVAGCGPWGRANDAYLEFVDTNTGSLYGGAHSVPDPNTGRSLFRPTSFIWTAKLGSTHRVTPNIISSTYRCATQSARLTFDFDLESVRRDIFLRLTTLGCYDNSLKEVTSNITISANHEVTECKNVPNPGMYATTYVWGSRTVVRSPEKLIGWSSINDAITLGASSLAKQVYLSLDELPVNITLREDKFLTPANLNLLVSTGRNITLYENKELTIPAQLGSASMSINNVSVTYTPDPNIFSIGGYSNNFNDVLASEWAELTYIELKSRDPEKYGAHPDDIHNTAGVYLGEREITRVFNQDKHNLTFTSINSGSGTQTLAPTGFETLSATNCPSFIEIRWPEQSNPGSYTVTYSIDPLFDNDTLKHTGASTVVTDISKNWLYIPIDPTNPKWHNNPKLHVTVTAENSKTIFPYTENHNSYVMYDYESMPDDVIDFFSNTDDPLWLPEKVFESESVPSSLSASILSIPDVIDNLTSKQFKPVEKEPFAVGSIYITNMPACTGYTTTTTSTTSTSTSTTSTSTTTTSTSTTSTSTSTTSTSTTSTSTTTTSTSTTSTSTSTTSTTQPPVCLENLDAGTDAINGTYYRNSGAGTTGQNATYAGPSPSTTYTIHYDSVMGWVVSPTNNLTNFLVYYNDTNATNPWGGNPDSWTDFGSGCSNCSSQGVCTGGGGTTTTTAAPFNSCSCGDTAVYEAYQCTGSNTYSSTPTYVCESPSHLGIIQSGISGGDYYYRGYTLPGCPTCNCYYIPNITDHSATQSATVVIGSVLNGTTQCDTPGNGGCATC